ncbi:MAG: type 2 isopentenyl-diphosphate Delta-isomerase [Candidatus Altiarchaeota archaeon]
MATTDRKTEHLRICLSRDVEAGSAGFEKVSLPHTELPELDLDKISTEASFLGKSLRFPLIIEALTGGTKMSKRINRDLAAVAQEFGIGFGVGSQRAALEDPKVADTYRVRDVAPGAFLIANLGAVQLNCGYGLEECRKAVEMIGADALALHVNPLQEAVQPEGDTNFEGLTKKINEIAKKLDVPLIVKGVGSGVSLDDAKKLKVSAIDVGGVGGTSWSVVESYRSGNDVGMSFAGWGMPTADCIIQLKDIGMPLVASGGVRSGIDIAKAVSMGASCAGIALPLLKAWERKKKGGVREYVQKTLKEFRIAMFLTGSENVEALKGKARY